MSTCARLRSAAFSSKLGFSVCCADQRHRAALHKGQKTVLLCTIEAMDLVDEQQGALTRLPRLLGLGEHLFEVGHAREHRADRHEAHAHSVGEQARDARLAGARRSPQHHARKLSRRHHPPDRAVGSTVRCSCPITSSSERGRRRSASGASSRGPSGAESLGEFVAEQICHPAGEIGRQKENCHRRCPTRISAGEGRGNRRSAADG